jgi:hypothetical protein
MDSQADPKLERNNVYNCIEKETQNEGVGITQLYSLITNLESGASSAGVLGVRPTINVNKSTVYFCKIII